MSMPIRLLFPDTIMVTRRRRKVGFHVADVGMLDLHRDGEEVATYARVSVGTIAIAKSIKEADDVHAGTVEGLGRR